MKKVLLLAATLIIAYSSNSFAGNSSWLSPQANGTWSLGTTVVLTGIKPSANVILGYGSTTATVNSVTTGIAYALGTYHTSGTFSYATSSGDTNIFRFPQKSDNTFQVPPASPTTATAGSDWTGWTASK